MILLGEIEDQIIQLVWSQISGPLFKISDASLANFQTYIDTFGGMLHPLTTNQPLIWLIMSICLTTFGLGFYNFFIFFSFLANLVISYLYFKRFKFGIFYSVIFSLSSFFWIHLGRHLVEMQLWIFPLYLFVITKDFKNIYKKIFIAGLLVCMTTLISNYFGYFLLLFTGIYYFSNVIVGIFRNKKIDISLLGEATGIYLVSAVLIFLFLFPYIKENYFTKGERDSAVSMKLHRPYEDFFTFSSRPWYFVLSPVKNPLFGDFTENALEKIKSGGYFLNDDYFAAEHSGNYLGNALLISTIVLFFYTHKRLNSGEKDKIYVEILSIVMLIVFMMPPFFTISGIKFYTPGEILHKLFPMFRTTSRMSVIVLLLLLSVFGRLVTKVYSVTNKKIIFASVSLITILTLISTYIPIEINNYSKPPQVYTYLNTHTSVNSIFAVYPEGIADEAFFWLPEHKRLLINPLSYFTKEFDSYEFTKNLNTANGIDKMRDLNVSYLIVSKEINLEDLSFFSSSSFIELVYEDSESLVFKVEK